MEASDLNPVAVLILKGTVEYPQRFGQPNSRPTPDYILNVGGEAGAQSSFADGSPASGMGQALGEAYRCNPLATDVRYCNCSESRGNEEIAAFDERIEAPCPPCSKEGCQGHLALRAPW